MANLLTPNALADRLGVPERTLAQWRYRNVGPSFIHVGRHVRYDEKVVGEWLDQQTVTHGESA